jgi:hypothetical protein
MYPAHLGVGRAHVLRPAQPGSHQLSSWLNDLSDIRGNSVTRAVEARLEGKHHVNSTG